jgi:hypothetical protein
VCYELLQLTGFTLSVAKSETALGGLGLQPLNTALGVLVPNISSYVIFVMLFS